MDRHYNDHHRFWLNQARTCNFYATSCDSIHVKKSLTPPLSPGRFPALYTVHEYKNFAWSSVTTRTVFCWTDVLSAPRVCLQLKPCTACVLFSLYKSTCTKAKDSTDTSHWSWKLGNPDCMAQGVSESEILGNPDVQPCRHRLMIVCRDWYKVAKIHDIFFCILAL